MPPLKIHIPGSFWDSYIYSGRLYLFGSDGSVRSIDWDRLVGEWAVGDELQIAMWCAFRRSDYLYSSDVQDLLNDREMKAILRSKFRRLSDANLDVTQTTMRRFTKGHQDNPCPFPHSDLEMYNKNLYVGSVSGVVRASCNKRTRYPISSRPERKWDGPALGLAASYGALAVAAGSEGLWEIAAETTWSRERKGPTRLSATACRDCNWAYMSVFASSDQSGFFAEFTKFQAGKYIHRGPRHFERIESAREIFGSTGYSWGVQDKLCQATGNSIKVMRYTPWAMDQAERIKSLGAIRFKEWKGDVVSAGTASFGVVVELDNALVVFPSSGPTITLRGEAVNWRVFPRSRNYENQLHIVYDDHLEILSFNHDYLVDQGQKILGTKFSSAGRRVIPLQADPTFDLA